MQPRTVLIAVASPQVREALVAMLGTVDGFRIVAEADTDEQALECARRERPHLALVDQELSNCGGWWAIQTMCRERLAQVVVGLGLRSDGNLAHMTGAQAYIQMGTSPRELLRALEGALTLADSCVQAKENLLPDAHAVVREPSLVDF